MNNQLKQLSFVADADHRKKRNALLTLLDVLISKKLSETVSRQRRSWFGLCLWASQNIKRQDLREIAFVQTIRPMADSSREMDPRKEKVIWHNLVENINA